MALGVVPITTIHNTHEQLFTLYTHVHVHLVRTHSHHNYAVKKFVVWLYNYYNYLDIFMKLNFLAIIHSIYTYLIHTLVYATCTCTCTDFC